MSELEGFKSRINLTEYAASQGYVLDRTAGSRNSVVMRHANGDKIIIARGSDGHWIYFSVRDEQDNGSIIDFVQHRLGCRLGRVRQELRPWLVGAGQGAGTLRRPPPTAYVPDLEATTRDRTRILLAWERMLPIHHHPYLEQDRGLPASVLNAPRFFGKLRQDDRGNAAFPHYNRQGLCGYELKNHHFTGFPKGGTKGLWFSSVRKNDTHLILAESAIDAISHAILFPNPTARYASIGGRMNPQQPDLLQSAIQRLATGATLIAATDHDEAGHQFADTLQALLQQTGRTDITYQTHWPEAPGSDWNDQLKNQTPDPQAEPLIGLMP